MGILTQVRAWAGPKANLLEAAQEMLLDEAMELTGGLQCATALLLNVSPRVINYRVNKKPKGEPDGEE